MITYSSCACCGSSNVKYQLSAKDYTVSQEQFDIWQCEDCTFRFTQHVPEQQAIGAYYQSENYISHTDTKAGIINKLYHAVRKRTLRGKRSIVQQYTGISKGKLLDIGAGTGAFLNTMQEAGWQVNGLEPDPQTRNRAYENYQLSLEPPDRLYQLPESSFDAITLWHVLEHVHDLDKYIIQIKKLLKPGSVLFIAVPNYTSYDAQIYQSAWAAYDVPRHLYHFSPLSIKKLLTRHGFKLQLIKPMWYDSFYVSMLSEQYKNGRSNHLSAIFNGLLSNIKAIFNNDKCSSLIYIIRKEN